MSLSKAMSTKLNQQIDNEFGASQSYLAIACQFESMSLKALAAFFRRQSDEERVHALKFADYILSVGGTVKLGALAAPKPSHASVVAAIDFAHKSELTVTSQIHELVELAGKDKDYPTRSFLKWFVDEQVEEVDTMAHLANIARMAGNDLLKLEGYVRHLNEKES